MQTTFDSPERLSALTQRYQDVLATTDAVRWLALKAHLGTSSNQAVADFFVQQFPTSPFAVTLRQKAAVPPVGIGSGGDGLLPPSTDPIIAIIRKETLPTRLALRKVP